MNGHLAERTFGRKDIWPKGHLAERTFGRTDIRRNGCLVVRLSKVGLGQIRLG